jgi:hypothetical protein
MVSHFSMRLLMTPILSETLAPTRLATRVSSDFQGLAHYVDFLFNQVAAYGRQIGRDDHAVR